MAWVTDHRPDRASLDSCVTCGLCLPVCPTFRLTGDETASPRGRLTAMTAVDSGTAAVDDRFRDIMSFCLQCRACETACPSLVPFGDVMAASRAEVEAQALAARAWRRRFAMAKGLRSRLLLRLAAFGAALLQRAGLIAYLPIVGGSARGLRRLSLTGSSVVGRSAGPVDGPVAMVLAGCVADAWFPALHNATIEVLVAAGYRVEVPEQQTCCGALASHGGFADDAAAMAAVNIAVFAGADVIVTDVAGCGAHVANYGQFAGPEIAAKVKDINELVGTAINDGRLPILAPTGTDVGIQDPCHLEHGLRAHTAVDRVIEAAGYVPKPIDRGGLCCGAAGVYQVEHPQVSDRLGSAKAEAAVASGVAIVASANIGCEMQLRRHLGTGYTVVHPIELYAQRLRDVRENSR